MSNLNDFNEIRKAYESRLPWMMEMYKKKGSMYFDPYFYEWKFTPIEAFVWQDIRGHGVPFYPQFPVLNYFVDFACPFKKIAIECDGKDWHDKKRDEKRDLRLLSDGWIVYRIQGHECVRIVRPWEERQMESEERKELAEKYFMDTSEGVVYAIKARHFGGWFGEGDRYIHLIEKTLEKHLSILGDALKK